MIKISVNPAQVCIERSKHGQHLNFDFMLENTLEQKLRVQKIQMSVLDKQGQLVLRKFIDDDAMLPSVNTLGKTELEEKGLLYVLNPFHTFNPGPDLHKLYFEFHFVSASGAKLQSEATVTPVYYETKTDLILPFKGRYIVHDGHDFYSHHRRTDLSHPIARQLGVNSIPVRYAYDFCAVNEHGDMYRTHGESNEDWFGYGAPVFAAGDGKVVLQTNDMPDNIMGQTEFDSRQILDNPLTMLGNTVGIDHGNGEFSGVSHLKMGSVTVEKGDVVKQGQLIGQIGLSGDAGSNVHIHYQITNGLDIWTAEGLPSYFRDFRRVLGAEIVKVERGQIDTGDIVETLD